MKKHLQLSMASALFIAGTTTALAIPFSPLDPRSMAMGGAGIASTSAASATAFNPAMLAAGETGDIEESFAVELPIVGMRIADPDDFVDSLDAFQNTGYIAALETSIANEDFASISTDIDNLNNSVDGLTSLSGKPLNIEMGGGMVVSIPGKSFAMALSATGNVYTSAVINYNDATVLTALGVDAGLASDCLASGGVGAACDALDPTTGSSTYITWDGANYTNTFDTATDLTSSVVATGASISDVGLSFAREFSGVAIGITPKMSSISTFYYEEGVNTADTGNASDTTTDYSDFNIDVGVAKDLGDGWRVGAVVKNLLANSYDYIDNTGAVRGAIEIEPMLRVGLSSQSDWYTVVADLDLTKNAPVGSGEEGTQYASIGAEFNAFRIVQLRVGYRTDLVNSDRSTVSAGFGLSPLGVHLDMAVAASDTEVGAALQFGFRF